MRWATVQVSGRGEFAGVVDGDRVAVEGSGRSLLQILQSGDLAGVGKSLVGSDAEYVSLSEVQLRAPVPTPPSVRDFVAFEAHKRNSAGGAAPPDVWYRMPTFYFSNPAAIVGPYDDVAIAPGSRAFDYELEVAAVIGRDGSDLDPLEATEHIAGFTILCDFSARDLQSEEMELRIGPAKGKDSATTLGPFLVTPDELAPFATDRGFGLEMTASVNGREYTRGKLDDMYWSFGELVAYASRGTTVRAGDVLGSGTVGLGCIFEHRALGHRKDHPWLKAGDVLELQVQGIGGIRHTIIPGPAVRPLRPAATTSA